MIAGIGKVESQHAAGYGLRPDGSTERPIIGPALNGDRFALVEDTDAGTWDSDTAYDHAVGPMQFLPSTWKNYGTDGRGLGKRDLHNIFDAAAGTAHYLCTGNKDLGNPADLDTALLRYNNSPAYVDAVKAWTQVYHRSESDPLTGIHHVTSLPNAPVPEARTAGKKSQAPMAPGRPSGPPAQPNTADAPVTSSGPSKAPTTCTSPRTPKPTEPPPSPGPDYQGDKHAGVVFIPPGPSTQAAVRPEPADATRTSATTAGNMLTSGLSVKAVDKIGKPVPDARITLTITNNTSHSAAHFPNNKRTITVTTNQDGTTTTPPITNNDPTGKLTLRATGKSTAPTDLTTTINPQESNEARSTETAWAPSSTCDGLDRKGSGATPVTEACSCDHRQHDQGKGRDGIRDDSGRKLPPGDRLSDSVPEAATIDLAGVMSWGLTAVVCRGTS
ncbi:lytic murein transglycosylase [Streptomyces klenkii]